MLGEVQKPGVYPLLGARLCLTCCHWLAAPRPKAGKLVSITHRDIPQTPTSVSLSNDAAESVHSNIDVFPATRSWSRGPAWCTSSGMCTDRAA